MKRGLKGNRMISDDEIKALWKSKGGTFHGPMAIGSMTEEELLLFLRELLEAKKFKDIADKYPEPRIFFSCGFEAGMKRNDEIKTLIKTGTVYGICVIADAVDEEYKIVLEAMPAVKEELLKN